MSLPAESYSYCILLMGYTLICNFKCPTIFVLLASHLLICLKGTFCMVFYQTISNLTRSNLSPTPKTLLLMSMLSLTHSLFSLPKECKIENQSNARRHKQDHNMKSLKPTRSRVTCSSSHPQVMLQGFHLSPFWYYW